MANNTINVVDLDFQSIKNSLRNFLRDNEQFKDFDYESSNMAMLIELMAANGYRTGFYQNMVLNESFLDSSVLRNSALSRSKELNYLPVSAKSARARVSVSFGADSSTAPYTIAKGSQLTALVKNDSYTFTIPNVLIVSSANNSYTFETDIYEGYYVNDTYTYPSGTTGRTFQITNENVDTDSISVTVYEDGNEVGEIYTYSTTLLDLTDRSKVYFLQPTGVGHYEILFGDNKLGRRPKGDSTIVINYRTSSGFNANGAREFVLDFDPTGNDELITGVTVNTLRNSFDGSEEESIESIKYNAPRHFQTQERAVSADDYKSILRSKFPEIKAINAFGGEELIPARYGLAMVSVVIEDGDALPDSKIQEYTDYLKERTTFGIVPKFISPSFTYINIESTVRYNVNITSNTKETIESLVRSAVINFRDVYLDDFDTIFRESALTEIINDTDQSIVSTIADYQIYKKINPTLAIIQDHKLTFGIPLRSDLLTEKGTAHPSNIISAVQSSNFYYKTELCVMDDDGAGKIRVMKINGSNHEKIVDIGTVDYETGTIDIKDLKVDGYVGSSIRFYVRPADPDVVTNLNNIISIEESEINITAEQVRI
jgi:hypothetical protein